MADNLRFGAPLATRAPRIHVDAGRTDARTSRFELEFVLAGILIGAFILRTVAKEESDKADRPRAGSGRLREAFSGRLVVIMLISSLMLGFFRGGAVEGASCNVAFSSVMLAVVAALVVRRDAWGIQEMLRSGVAFVSAGVLLAPLISAAVPGSDVALEAVGMGFFEATTWLLAVRCVRLSRWMAGAAAGARLLATLGHSLGAALAAGATMLVSFGISMQAASLLLVFVYVMAAMFFFREDTEFIAGTGYRLQTKNLNGIRRSGLCYGIALRIKHGTDAAKCHTRHKSILEEAHSRLQDRTS